MSLTENQTKAIYTLNKNILLNAGAGTGKTEVLTRRFVEMIRSGISLENIVCINSAAAVVSPTVSLGIELNRLVASARKLAILSA